MSTLNDIIDFMRSGTKPFREWEAGVAERATPEGFAAALSDNLSMDPRTGDFGVLGAGSIHGISSKIFPASWKGKEGKFWKMMDEGASPQEIWDKSYAETGYGIFPKHQYRDGKFVRTDVMMNVPDINVRPGKRTRVENLDPRQNYPLTDFIRDPDTQRGYPGLLEGVNVNVQPNAVVQGSSARIRPYKYGEKAYGTGELQINKDFSEIEDSLMDVIPHERGHLISDIERFPPGGNPTSHANYPNLSDEVLQRASQLEYDTIQNLRAQKMSDLEIRDYLAKESPIWQNFDTPDIMQEAKKRVRSKAPEWSDSTMVRGDKLFDESKMSEIYELERSGMSKEDIFNKTGVAPFTNRAGEPTYLQFLDNSDTIVNKQGVMDIIDGNDVQLTDLISSPRLLENNPELANVAIKYDGTSRGSNFNAETNTITLGSRTTPIFKAGRLDTPDKFDESLFHEIDHAIQESKYLPRGGNEEVMKEMLDRTINMPKSDLRNQLINIKNFNRQDPARESYERLGGELLSNIAGYQRTNPGMSPTKALAKSGSRATLNNMIVSPELPAAIEEVITNDRWGLPRK